MRIGNCPQLVEPHSSLADMYDFLLQYIQVREECLSSICNILECVTKSTHIPEDCRFFSLSAYPDPHHPRNDQNHHHPNPHNHQHQRIAGDESIGFNNSVFLSERASADRNFSMGYFMKVVMMLCYDDDDNADYNETPSTDRIFFDGLLFEGGFTFDEL